MKIVWILSQMDNILKTADITFEYKDNKYIGTW